MKRTSWFKILFLVFLPLVGFAGLYLTRVQFLGLISFYGLLSVGWLLFQTITSHFVRNFSYPIFKNKVASIIITVYNEDPAIFDKALKSFVNQKDAITEVIVVDDGSNNHSHIEEICRKHNVYYYFQVHQGKRQAMHQAFSLVRPDAEYILTGDSDTIWDKHAARDMISALAANPRTGAVTGYVGIWNKEDNFLTLLVAMRYWMAFNQERASQSLFGCVTCVSGPLGGYRRDLIERFKDKFLTQTFMGKACTFGDDRHLTNLVLIEGYQVRYSQAQCWTMAPTNIFEYVKQQTRWGKSHWRETLWQFKALTKQSLYLSWNLGLTFLLPFLLIASITNYIYLASTSGIPHLYPLFATIFGMTFIRIFEPMRVTRDPRFIFFSCYSLFHVFILLPVKFYSLATVNVSGWGTRGNNAKTKNQSYLFMRRLSESVINRTIL